MLGRESHQVSIDYSTVINLCNQTHTGFAVKSLLLSVSSVQVPASCQRLSLPLEQSQVPHGVQKVALADGSQDSNLALSRNELKNIASLALCS